MTEFDKEVQHRKEISRSSAKRVNGSKSKKMQLAIRQFDKKANSCYERRGRNL